MHIADVSHFVKESTPLDDEAAMRTTSTYMPHRVIPMLPRSLCEHVCSLQPEKSRLAFSVVYKLAPDGDVIEDWIGKTVIRSRCQMSYDHAQVISTTCSALLSLDGRPSLSPQISSLGLEFWELLKRQLLIMRVPINFELLIFTVGILCIRAVIFNRGSAEP